MILYDNQQFPNYEYTFVVQKLLFDMGCMEVKYTPVDTTLSAIVLIVPIWPDLDVNNMKPYLDEFMPKDKWYAQQVITNHGNTILGT